ncbi:MAG: hypothetical protein JW801_06915 [Bacteroidales bacterium]|nr:hypothetical protein [Bacteroidales bacterium]
MKKITLFIILGFLMTLASAQTTPEEYTKLFFDKIEKSDFEGAFQALPMGDLIADDSSSTTNLVKKLEDNAKQMGKYCGFELISTEETSPSFISYTYFIKYKNAPQRIVFVFYKPEDTWQVNRVNIAGGTNARSNRSNANPQSRFRM